VLWLRRVDRRESAVARGYRISTRHWVPIYFHEVRLQIWDAERLALDQAGTAGLARYNRLGQRETVSAYGSYDIAGATEQTRR
jgi:hypothetical protein